jgi:hypothetical protein
VSFEVVARSLLMPTNKGTRGPGFYSVKNLTLKSASFSLRPVIGLAAIDD